MADIEDLSLIGKDDWKPDDFDHPDDWRERIREEYEDVEQLDPLVFCPREEPKLVEAAFEEDVLPMGHYGWFHPPEKHCKLAHVFGMIVEEHTIVFVLGRDNVHNSHSDYFELDASIDDPFSS